MRAIAILQREPIKCTVLRSVRFERHGMAKMKWSNYAFFCLFFFLLFPTMTTTLCRVNVWNGWTFVTFNCVNATAWMLISLVLTFYQLKSWNIFFFFFLLSSILLLLLLLISIYTNCPYLHFQLLFSSNQEKKFSVWFNTFVSHDNGNRFLVLRFFLQNIFSSKEWFFEFGVMWVL